MITHIGLYHKIIRTLFLINLIYNHHCMQQSIQFLNRQNYISLHSIQSIFDKYYSIATIHTSYCKYHIEKSGIHLVLLFMNSLHNFNLHSSNFDNSHLFITMQIQINILYNWCNLQKARNIHSKMLDFRLLNMLIAVNRLDYY